MSTPQLPWRGLTTSGGSMSRLTVGPEMLGARMRDPRPGEQAGGEQLVVCGGEGRGRVEDTETAPLEPEELEEAGLDTVDGREDVEPAERDVTRLEPFADLARERRAPRRCRALCQAATISTLVLLAPVPRTATRVVTGAVSLACALGDRRRASCGRLGGSSRSSARSADRSGSRLVSTRSSEACEPSPIGPSPSSVAVNRLVVFASEPPPTRPASSSDRPS